MELDTNDRTTGLDAGTGREWTLAFGVSLGTALLVITPFFRFGNAWGHDFMFHATSWMDVAHQWREEIFYPRWAEGANSGFGEPRFIFYPPLSWMLGGGLGLLLPWTVVPPVFIVIVQTLAGLNCYALARRFLPIEGALWGAGCYVANPYAFLDIYARSAFAELLACALIPLALLASLELSGLVWTRLRSVPRATAFFAAAFAAVWLSNVPAGVMVTYSAVLILVWAAVEERSLRPCWRGANGLLLGFGLISFYIVPAAYEQHWTSIGEMFSRASSLQFLYARLGLITRTGRIPFHWVASNVAVLLIATAAAAGVVVYRRIFRDPQNDNQRKLWRTLLLLSVTVTFLMTPFSSVFWAHLPKLFVVQFPWRWIGILAVVFALALAAAISSKQGRWIWSAVALTIASTCAIVFVKQAWWNTQDFLALQEAVANDAGYFGWPEYYPNGVHLADLPENAPRVRILEADNSCLDSSNAQVRITRWTAEEKNVQVTSNEPVCVAFRLVSYPAWLVEVNGKVVRTQPNTHDQVIVPVPAGESDVHAVFVRTPDRVGGDILSGASLLALMITFLASKRASEVTPA